MEASLYEAVGGAAGLRALARAHHERCLADPVLNHPFSHPGHPDHVERLAGYWGEVFGGPPAYSSLVEGGGHTAMLAIHAGQGADEELGQRFVACFVAAADDAGLPTDPALRAALRSYMEWAVREVHAYSPRGSVVPTGLGVPRWSWHGLVPELRPATVDDAGVVARIWAEGWADGHRGHTPAALAAARTEESFRQRATARVADTVVAEVLGAVVGFVMVAGDEVEQLYVDRGQRGTGVAGALLAEGHRRVRSGGHDRAWLAVATGNERARRFYARQGWIDDGGFTYVAEGGIDVPCHRYVSPV